MALARGWGTLSPGRSYREYHYGMAPTDEPLRSSLGQGSGDLRLELAISNLRTAMIRVINELDLFTEAVKLARTELDELHQEHTDEGNNN